MLGILQLLATSGQSLVSSLNASTNGTFNNLSSLEIQRLLMLVVDQLQSLTTVFLSDSGHDIRDDSEVISVQQLRMIYTLMEIVWQLVLKPFTEKYADFSLPDREFPKSILINEDAILFVSRNLNSFENLNVNSSYIKFIWSCVLAEVNMVLNEMFMGLMFVRNVDRLILASLILEKLKSGQIEFAEVFKLSAFSVNVCKFGLKLRRILEKSILPSIGCVIVFTITLSLECFVRLSRHLSG